MRYLDPLEEITLIFYEDQVTLSEMLCVMLLMTLRMDVYSSRPLLEVLSGSNLWLSQTLNLCSIQRVLTHVISA